MVRQSAQRTEFIREGISSLRRWVQSKERFGAAVGDRNGVTLLVLVLEAARKLTPLAQATQTGMDKVADLTEAIDWLEAYQKPFSDRDVPRLSAAIDAAERHLEQYERQAMSAEGKAASGGTTIVGGG